MSPFPGVLFNAGSPEPRVSADPEQALDRTWVNALQRGQLSAYLFLNSLKAPKREAFSLDFSVYQPGDMWKYKPFEKSTIYAVTLTHEGMLWQNGRDEKAHKQSL